MPPSSSSGCAVTIKRLARVCSFCKLCQRAAAPRSKGRGSAATVGLCVSAPGDWAFAPSDQVNRVSEDTHAVNRLSANVWDRDAIVLFPSWRTVPDGKRILLFEGGLSTKNTKTFWYFVHSVAASYDFWKAADRRGLDQSPHQNDA